jgi:hypothetical protein
MFLLYAPNKINVKSTKGAPASGQGNALLIWAVHGDCPEGAKANALMNG